MPRRATRQEALDKSINIILGRICQYILSVDDVACLINSFFVRKWLPNIRKLSQSKLEKSQSLGGHDAKNINRQIYKANFKVSFNLVEQLYLVQLYHVLLTYFYDICAQIRYSYLHKNMLNYVDYDWSWFYILIIIQKNLM